jgi:hypothetical protein
MYKRLSGFNIRKAMELEISIEDIFQITTEEEGDKAAKEIYIDDITHSSEIDNIDDIFKNNQNIIFYYSPKEEIIINENLKAYIYDFYVASIESEEGAGDSRILSEKSKEIMFLNTKVLEHYEFVENVMAAQRFLGKFEQAIFKRKFIGIGGFQIEEYALNHLMVQFSEIHLLDFFIKDSNIISTITNIISAEYEKDIIEQKEYFTDEEFQVLMQTVRKHRKILNGKSDNIGFEFM